MPDDRRHNAKPSQQFATSLLARFPESGGSSLKLEMARASIAPSMRYLELLAWRQRAHGRPAAEPVTSLPTFRFHLRKL
jgi:hypothetical protein